jgi:hypothetical protein
MAGEVLWASLILNEVYEGSDDQIVLHRCRKCVEELCGFTPVWGRILKEYHVCERCGGTGKVMKFMVPVPYPGLRKAICVECFKEVGLVNIEGGGVVDQG